MDLQPWQIEGVVEVCGQNRVIITTDFWVSDADRAGGECYSFSDSFSRFSLHARTGGPFSANAHRDVHALLCGGAPPFRILSIDIMSIILLPSAGI